MTFRLMAALLVAGCASAMTPKSNSRAEIASFVDRAVRVVHDSGPSCSTFQSSAWKSGQWYIFILDADGRTVCHADRPERAGSLASDTVDATGKRIAEEFVRAATAHPGGAWVDYVWPRPGSRAPVAKSSFVRLVPGPSGTSYIVGSGGYELKE